MKWNNKIPNHPGYWLHLNVRHKITMVHIWRSEKHLCTYWGLSDGGATILKSSDREKWKHTFSGGQWYGPIPVPEGWVDNILMEEGR